MKIRKAGTSDAPLLLEYLEAFIEEKCPTTPRFSALPTLEQEEQWLAQRMEDKGIALVAETEDHIVGLIEATRAVAPEFRHNCEFGMSVLASHRRRGLGRRLLDEFLSWTDQEGLWRIELNVFGNNIPAIRLYEDLGFQEDGRRVKAVRLSDGGYCDLVHMSLFTSSGLAALVQGKES